MAVMLNGVGDIYAVNITHHLRAFKKISNYQIALLILMRKLGHTAQELWQKGVHSKEPRILPIIIFS